MIFSVQILLKCITVNLLFLFITVPTVLEILKNTPSQNYSKTKQCCFKYCFYYKDLNPLCPPDARMECCDVEPRYTIEQIDLLQRLRLSGMTKPQIIQALESLERLDPDHRAPCCTNHTTPSGAPTSAAPAAPSSSSSSSSSLTSATTQTPVMESALSPSNSYEASPPPMYPPSGVQRSYSYELAEEDWDLEEKVEEYMRYLLLAVFMRFLLSGLQREREGLI